MLEKLNFIILTTTKVSEKKKKTLGSSAARFNIIRRADNRIRLASRSKTRLLKSVDLKLVIQSMRIKTVLIHWLTLMVYLYRQVLTRRHGSFFVLMCLLKTCMSPSLYDSAISFNAD